MQIESVEMRMTAGAKAAFAVGTDCSATGFAAFFAMVQSVLAGDSPSDTVVEGENIVLAAQDAPSTLPIMDSDLAPESTILADAVPENEDTAERSPRPISARSKVVAQQARIGVIGGAVFVDLGVGLENPKPMQVSEKPTPDAARAATTPAAGVLTPLVTPADPIVLDQPKSTMLVNIPPAGPLADVVAPIKLSAETEYSLPTLGADKREISKSLGDSPINTAPLTATGVIKGFDVSDGEVNRVPLRDRKAMADFVPMTHVSHARFETIGTLVPIAEASIPALARLVTEEGTASADSLETLLIAGDDRQVRGLDLSAGPQRLQSHHANARLDPVAVAVLRDAALAATGNAARLIELDTGSDTLGKISLSIQSQDGTLMVTLLSGRPEALELLRRTVGMFLRELAAQGFDDVDLHIGPRADGGDRRLPQQAWSRLGVSTDDPRPSTFLMKGHFDKRL